MITSQYQWSYISQSGQRFAGGEAWAQSEAEARELFADFYPYFAEADGVEVAVIQDGTKNAALVEAADVLAAETGLPVHYGFHGKITLNRGVLVETHIAPTVDAVRAAWGRMGGSIWNGGAA